MIRLQGNGARLFLRVRRRSDETDRRWPTPPSDSEAEEEEDPGVSARASGPSQATVGRALVSAQSRGRDL